MSLKPREITREKLLLVEGKDEVNFFEALLEQSGIEGFEIIDVGGKRNFAKELKMLALLTGFEKVKTLIIVRDADDNADDAFASARSALHSIHFHTPNCQNELREYEGRKVGIYIMPGNFENGMLEDLCMSSVADQPVISCIESFFECIKQKGCIPKNLSKAKAHVFLASQSELVTSIGVAAKKGYWNFSHPSLQALTHFFQEA